MHLENTHAKARVLNAMVKLWNVQIERGIWVDYVFGRTMHGLLYRTMDAWWMMITDELSGYSLDLLKNENSQRF